MTELFAVYDAAAKRYIDPFTGPTIEFALRGFREACETEGHQFRKFPEDYTLFHIGTFDPETGLLVGNEGHKVGMALSFVNTVTPADPMQLSHEDVAGLYNGKEVERA